MNRRALAFLALSLVVAVAACKKRETPPPEPPPVLAAADGFAHDPSFDPAGYYTPTTEVKVGDYQLTNLAMGAPSDFEMYEGGEREAVFGPIIIDLSDVTSAIVTNEMGGEGRAVTLRPVLSAYRMYPGDVSFKASDPAVGEVVFVGKFDQAAIDAAQTATSSGSTPVLTGSLQIGTQHFDNVGFSYWIGD